MPRPEQDSGYWGLCLKGVEEASKDLQSYGAEIKYYLYDRHSEHNIKKTYMMLQKQSAPVLSRIGQASYNSGFLAGKLMSLLLCGGDNVLAIDISETDYHIQKRVEGFLDFFKEKKGKKIPSLISSDTDSLDLVLKRLDSYFKQNSRPRGIFVPNATTHLYAKCCNSLNIKDIKIVGYDSVPENIQCLKTGMIDFIISQRPEYQGAEALQNLFRSLMLQIDVPKKIDVPIDIITRENLP